MVKTRQFIFGFTGVLNMGRKEKTEKAAKAEAVKEKSYEDQEGQKGMDACRRANSQTAFSNFLRE